MRCNPLTIGVPFRSCTCVCLTDAGAGAGGSIGGSHLRLGGENLRLGRFILAPTLNHGRLHLVARGLKTEPALCPKLPNTRCRLGKLERIADSTDVAEPKPFEIAPVAPKWDKAEPPRF